MTTLDVRQSQEDLYREASATFLAALERLARAYEADPESRRDLLQEIHLALWRSFESFDGRCSLRTWVYRVAHNAAASHVGRQRKNFSRQLVSLEEAETAPDPKNGEAEADRQEASVRLLELVRQLKPLDRQVIVSYLEGLDAATIAEITALSPGNVATKIHRLKHVLARRFHEGGSHAE
jgi:RNA polymerase sigma-70 factor (ECF subfamily)